MTIEEDHKFDGKVGPLVPVNSVGCMLSFQSMEIHRYGWRNLVTTLFAETFDMVSFSLRAFHTIYFYEDTT